MFNSPYEAFSRETKNPEDEKHDSHGEPLKKDSRHSEVSHTLNKHEDGHYSVETPEEGVTNHDDLESAVEHLSASTEHHEETPMGKQPVHGHHHHVSEM